MLDQLTAAILDNIAMGSELFYIAAYDLCMSLARFLRGLLSLLDRGKVFVMIHKVLEELHRKDKGNRQPELAQLRLLLLRVVSWTRMAQLAQILKSSMSSPLRSPAMNISCL